MVCRTGRIGLFLTGDKWTVCHLRGERQIAPLGGVNVTRWIRQYISRSVVLFFGDGRDRATLLWDIYRIATQSPTFIDHCRQLNDEQISQTCRELKIPQDWSAREESPKAQRSDRSCSRNLDGIASRRAALSSPVRNQNTPERDISR
jgi:hypothetical protein